MSEKRNQALEKQRIRSKAYYNRQKEKKLKLEEEEKNNLDGLAADKNEENIDNDLNENADADLEKHEVYYECSDELNNDRSHLYLLSDIESDVSDSDNEDNSNTDSVDVCIESMKIIYLMTQLRKWGLEFQVTRVAFDSLLHILHPHFSELPLSSKTIMKKKSTFVTLIKKLVNPEDAKDISEFVYFGISRYLQRMVNLALHKSKVLKLQFNMDGFPLFKSSKLEFWPIIGKIFSTDNINYKPFIVAIHSGMGKPVLIEEYLSDFVQEINHLIKNGILIKGQKFAVELMCFICDRPARSVVKCIINHGGYYACERCVVIGDSSNSRRVYGKIGSNDRTHVSFIQKSSPSHHSGTSPLTRIVGIDMIKHFILDAMHLIFLGIMKKLLTEFWLHAKLIRDNMLRLSQRLTNLSNQIPCEFQRTTRSLSEIVNWKATEYRFFLLYSGPFLLQDLLPQDVYQHFLLLVTSIRILSSDLLCFEYVDLAKSYLKGFVFGMESLYGKESLVLNVHSLLHVADDVKNMMCSLSKLTAFAFESKLGLLRKYIKCGRKPLVQVCNKIEEEFEVDNDTVELSDIKILKSTNCNGLLTIRRLKLYSSELSTKDPNNTVLLKNKKVIQIESMTLENDKKPIIDVCFSGQVLKVLGPALTFPKDSSRYDMYEVEPQEPQNKTSERIQFSVSDIECKMVLIKVFEFDTDPQKWYVLPLLHCS